MFCRRRGNPGSLCARPSPAAFPINPTRPLHTARPARTDPRRGLVMPADGAPPTPQEATPAAVSAPLPGARSALLLLLAINLFNYIDRQVLAAVEPEIR